MNVGDNWREKTPEQKALHAQSLISTELAIPALKLHCHDVNEYKKDLLKQQAQSVDIDSLVRQVIEVLPNIPENEIRADLRKFQPVLYWQDGQIALQESATTSGLLPILGPGFLNFIILSTN